MEQCAFEPQEILFIDDNAINLKPAAELGISVLEAKTAAGAKRLLFNCLCFSSCSILSLSSQVAGIEMDGFWRCLGKEDLENNGCRA